MATPFMTEIKIISWNFAPKGWAFCNGQLMPINQNQALFSLLGTTYGGNGQTTFGLPDLRGKCAVSFGQGFTLGQQGGEENHTLSIPELPAHNHSVSALSGAGDVFNPGTHIPAGSAPLQMYSSGGGGMQSVTMNPAMVSSTGGSQAHQNMMPYIVMNFVIALTGIFPSRN